MLAFPFVKAVVPEKGRSLEELEAYPQGKAGAGDSALAGAGGSARSWRGVTADERTPRERTTR